MSVRAVVFPGPNQVVLRDDLQPPPVGPSDVGVRTTFSGISVGTERNFLTNGSYRLGFPQLPGYQIVGVVAEAGNGVTALTVGDRVYAHLFWNRQPPEESFAWVGSHASYHVGPERGTILRLPDDIPDDEASLLSVAAIGLHGTERAGGGPGVRVLVFGLGIIGQFAAQAVRALGGSAVGVDRHEARRRAALDLGLVQAEAPPDDAEAWQRLAASGPFDAVVETTSNADVLNGLVEYQVVRPGARIAMLGGRTHLDYPFNRAQERELELVHSMHHSEADVLRILEFRRAGTWLIGPLITHRLAPGEVPAFWARVLDGWRDYLGVVIDWGRT
jgi:2-desacetyl-2-hydroxyethyl bacteriochlorophyllide A dehydrogenase